MGNDIGERIKNKRKELKLTQNQLADKIFISASYLALIESGKRIPSTEVLKLLSKTLGISFDYLLFGNSDNKDLELFSRWKSLTDNRSAEEINAAFSLVKYFFEITDKMKKE